MWQQQKFFLFRKKLDFKGTKHSGSFTLFYHKVRDFFPRYHKDSTYWKMDGSHNGIWHWSPSVNRNVVLFKNVETMWILETLEEVNSGHDIFFENLFVLLWNYVTFCSRLQPLCSRLLVATMVLIMCWFSLFLANFFYQNHLEDYFRRINLVQTFI